MKISERKNDFGIFAHPMHNMIFSDFSPESKVWIYQAARPLTPDECAFLETAGGDFTQTWKAHGADLKASCKVLYNRFLVFVSDESFNRAGGCSIDKLLQLIQHLQSEIGCSLLDRMNIACMNGESIEVFHLKEAPAMLEKGILRLDSLVFNNAVATLGSMREEWQRPLEFSFLKKFLKTHSAL